MMFFTPGNNFTPCCTACATILLQTSTSTAVTPGNAATASVTFLRISSIWLRAG
jgi:hypothetical protein